MCCCFFSLLVLFVFTNYCIFMLQLLMVMYIVTRVMDLGKGTAYFLTLSGQTYLNVVTIHNTIYSKWPRMHCFALRGEGGDPRTRRGCFPLGLDEKFAEVMKRQSHRLWASYNTEVLSIGKCIWSALFVVPHTQVAWAWITQCYLQLHQCLPLPHKCSQDGASPADI